MIVRDATADDWAQIWPFLSQIVKAGETFAYDQAMDEPEARAAWLVGPPGRTTVAVGSDGAVVGTANMYPNRNGPGGHVASGSFMVDPSRWGLGTGRALCEDMVAWAREPGLPRNSVQRGGGDEHARGQALPLTWLRGGRNGSRGVSAPDGGLRRAPRDAPAAVERASLLDIRE